MRRKLYKAGKGILPKEGQQKADSWNETGAEDGRSEEKWMRTLNVLGLPEPKRLPGTRCVTLCSVPQSCTSKIIKGELRLNCSTINKSCHHSHKKESI
jgi:hypothetical protein